MRFAMLLAALGEREGGVGAVAGNVCQADPLQNGFHVQCWRWERAGRPPGTPHPAPRAAGPSAAPPSCLLHLKAAIAAQVSAAVRLQRTGATVTCGWGRCRCCRRRRCASACTHCLAADACMHAILRFERTVNLLQSPAPALVCMHATAVALSGLPPPLPLPRRPGALPLPPVLQPGGHLPERSLPLHLPMRVLRQAESMPRLHASDQRAHARCGAGGAMRRGRRHLPRRPVLLRAGFLHRPVLAVAG